MRMNFAAPGVFAATPRERTSAPMKVKKPNMTWAMARIFTSLFITLPRIAQICGLTFVATDGNSSLSCQS